MCCPRAGSSWFQLVPVASSWFQLVSVGSSAQCPCSVQQAEWDLPPVPALDPQRGPLPPPDAHLALAAALQATSTSTGGSMLRSEDVRDLAAWLSEQKLQETAGASVRPSISGSLSICLSVCLNSRA